MKNSRLIFAAAIAAISLGACNKNAEPEVTTTSAWAFTVNASKVSDLTKALSQDGNTITATWTEGDEVTVYKEDGTTQIGILKATETAGSTTLAGEISAAPAEGDKLVLTYGSNDYSIQEGKSVEYIGENFDFGKATVEVTAVNAEDRTITTTDAEFDSKQAIVKFTLKDSDGNALTGISEFKIYYGTYLITVTPASATDDPLYVALPLCLDTPIILSAVSGGKVYSKTVDSFTTIDGGYYIRSVKMAENALAAATADYIGKIITTDGSIYDTVSDAENDGKTAAAIIACVGSKTGNGMFNHGLAIALEDASENYCQWNNENSPECLVDPQTTLHYSGAIVNYSGIANTNVLVADGHSHEAAKAAASFGASRPDGVSSWYLPALGEWNMIVLGLTGESTNMPLIENDEGQGIDAYKADNVNLKITAAGGTGLKTGYYWSSTEYNDVSAWRVDFKRGSVGWYGKKGGPEDYEDKVYVRAVLAF